jgi:hypothetical protein
VAAAVAAGIANWLRLRRDPELAAALAAPEFAGGGLGSMAGDRDHDGHRIFVDPWADDEETWRDADRRGPPGPSELP